MVETALDAWAVTPSEVGPEKVANTDRESGTASQVAETKSAKYPLRTFTDQQGPHIAALNPAKARRFEVFAVASETF
jgi:hypothetical protein